MDPDLIRSAIALLLILAGATVAALTARSLLRRRHDRRHGALVSIDRAAGPARTIVSDAYGLVGRPDALRQLPDGRTVPIEIKHRATPRNGPTASHRIQVEAYCLLVESSTGRSPPYGLLRYSDGGEFTIPWNDRARSELLRLRAAIDRPYDGAATPSPGRCARCGWRSGCDARALGGSADG